MDLGNVNNSQNLELYNTKDNQINKNQELEDHKNQVSPLLQSAAEEQETAVSTNTVVDVKTLYEPKAEEDSDPQTGLNAKEAEETAREASQAIPRSGLDVQGKVDSDEAQRLLAG